MSDNRLTLVGEIVDMTASARAATPVWYWIVAAAAVVWNGFPVLLYINLQTGGPPEGMPPEQVAYFEAFPAWYVTVWALTVFIAFGSSLALLLRSRFAETGFLATLPLYATSIFYHYGIAGAWDLLGPGNAAFSAVIALSLVALWAFARSFRRRGVLR